MTDLKKNQPFSLRSRFKSIKYAFDGVDFFLKKEHNALLHSLATIIVIILAVTLHISETEAIALAFAIGFVWTAELFNTAIERIMDFISKDKNPEIKQIKDMAAAAVLVSAVIAAIVGCIVFIPKI